MISIFFDFLLFVVVSHEKDWVRRQGQGDRATERDLLYFEGIQGKRGKKKNRDLEAARSIRSINEFEKLYFCPMFDLFCFVMYRCIDLYYYIIEIYRLLY